MKRVVFALAAVAAFAVFGEESKAKNSPCACGGRCEKAVEPVAALADTGQLDALVVPREEWNAILARLDALEKFAALLKPLAVQREKANQRVKEQYERERAKRIELLKKGASERINAPKQPSKRAE